MAKEYLDKDGLLYFWQKIKNLFSTKSDTVKSISRSGTTFTATRADGTTFTFTQQDNNTWNANTKDVDGYVTKGTGNANKVWKTDANGNPAWRNDENTTYSAATQSAPGLMSAADKTKLDGVATGAEVNQNAFAKIKVGDTTIEADAKSDTLELAAGSNVTLTPDATNDKVTITAKDTTYTPASATPKMDGTGAVGASDKYAREDHVHPSDTAKVDKVAGKGLSTNDFTDELKSKLEAIESGAQKNVQSDWSAQSGDAAILNKPFYYDTTANWNSKTSLVSQVGAYYVYSDYKTRSVNGDTINIPNIKIGDGKAFVVDLPFVETDSDELLKHINNSIIHITSTERSTWNNKVTAYISDTDSETVVFSN